MKKLLIAMTAAAVGFGAWATENAPTLLNENFNSDWANGTDLEYMTALPVGKTLWSYSAQPLGEGELKVVDAVRQNEPAGKALSLNTGSKTLTANFASSPLTIPQNTGYYFSSKVTFKDPSDTLPTLGEQDKFALVVLDNVESAAEGQNTTNLWVIAKYGPDNEVKRAFQLKFPISGAKPELDDNGGQIIENIDAGWLAAEHEIVVKFYNNVMKSGYDARAGFMVMIDGYICAVVKACEINSENVINLSNVVFADGATEYLGFAATAIDDSVGQRYTKDQLLLSIIDSNASLSSVDFQGQGVIDDVALATSGFDFGSDATVVTFEGYNSAAIESITYGGQTVTDGAYTITGNENFGDTVNIVVTLNSGYALEDEDGDIHTDSYTFSKAPATASETIELDVFKIKAYVGKVACRSFADALDEAVAQGGTVTLADDLELEIDPVTVSADTTITLDLAGKTISTKSPEMPAIVNNGNLTIIDSGDCGKVAGAVAGEGTFVLMGGGYLASANSADNAFTLAKSVANGYQVSDEPVEGYWVVTAQQIVNYTVEASFDANQVTVTDLTTGTVAKDTVLSFTVAAKPGFEIVDVKAGNTELTAGANGAYTWTVAANVTITITSRAVASIDDEEGTITVDNSGNANITSTNETVTITGTITGDITVQPGVGTVNVTLAEGKTVKIYEGSTNISGAFTVSVDKDAGKVTITLNEDGYVDIDDERIYVKPEMAAASGDDMDAPLEVGNTVDVGVKTIPGLMYQLIRSGTPNGTFNGVGDAVKGTGAPVKLSDGQKPDGKAFYKIKVMPR